MITENISSLYKKMSRAAIKTGVEPFDINLIAVTKGFPVESVKEAADAGLRLFGESRVQEAEEKIDRFSLIASAEGFSGIQWHLIGHLQGNKVRQAVRLFDLIHSLDSLSLAETIDKEAARINKVQQVLIQVKVSEEETKHGISEDSIIEFLRSVSAFENISVLGLMTIPPYFENPQESRPYFHRLSQIKEQAEGEGFTLPYLSMGMSNDFEVAIEEGATHIRIGTAIFGQR